MAMLGKVYQRLKAHRVYTGIGVNAAVVLAAWGAKFAGLPGEVRWGLFLPLWGVGSLVWVWAFWPVIRRMFSGSQDDGEALVSQGGRGERVGNDRSRRRRNRPAGRRK